MPVNTRMTSGGAVKESPRLSLQLMRVSVALLVVWMWVPTQVIFASTSAVDAPSNEWHTMDWMGLERLCGVYVPSSTKAWAAVVFVLHGGGGSAAQTCEQDSGRSWRALADEHGFVLVLPQGRPGNMDADSNHWNDCRYTTSGRTTLRSA